MFSRSYTDIRRLIDVLHFKNLQNIWHLMCLLTQGLGRVRQGCFWQHQSTSGKMMGTEGTLHFTSFAGRILSNRTSRTQHRRLLNFAKTRQEGPSKFPAPQKSLSYIQAGCPSFAEEPRGTAQTAWCPCHQVTFHPSGVFDGVEH